MKETRLFKYNKELNRTAKTLHVQSPQIPPEADFLSLDACSTLWPSFTGP